VPSQQADPNAVDPKPIDDRSGTTASLDEVRAIMSEIGLCPADVAADARLVDDLGLDSLDWVDFALRVETLLGIELRDEKLASLVTVADVAELVRERRAARAGGRA
jgi:acyl carrier protein